MSVHCGRKQRGRRLMAKCLCIIHAACKLASCSLLERNCPEFEIHFLFPHSRAAARKAAGFQWHRSAQTTVSFCFPSSIILQRRCFNASVFLMCCILHQIELYSMQYPTCSLMYFQYMHFFFSFILSFVNLWMCQGA